MTHDLDGSQALRGRRALHPERSSYGDGWGRQVISSDIFTVVATGDRGSKARALGALLIFGLVLSAIAGCTTSAVTCSCTDNEVPLPLPADLPADVARVAADQPCSAVSEGDAGVAVTIKSGAGSGTCAVRIELTNGDTYLASVTYQPLPGCCSDVANQIDSSAFEPSDAGGE